MLVNKQQVENENQILEQKVLLLEALLRKNKKDLKYNIGLAIGENLRPRKNILKIRAKLKEVTKGYPGSSILSQNTQYTDPWMYHKFLEESIQKLTFYNEKDTSDILFAIGSEVYNARHSATAFLCLPLRLWKIRSQNRRLVNAHVQKLPPIKDLDKSILFIATNGAGLGHLTRCLAVARQLKTSSPDTEIVFLTTSPALSVIYKEGFIGYCIPSLMLLHNMSSGQWNAMLRNMMTELLDLYQFSAVVFDGASPYASITSALADNYRVPKVWIRRGNEKTTEIAEKRKLAEKDFDAIIIPGEADAPQPDDDANHFYVDPIICLDRSDLWTKEAVRRYLKIPQDHLAVYIQLGAGNINDIDSDIGKIVSELRKHPNITMVLGESIIGNELHIIEDDIIVIKDYPNSKYFNGFDFAISACGYNSFHELLYFAVPTIYLPNQNTKTDDQMARAMIAQNHGAGIVVTNLDDDQIREAISKMCNLLENKQMRENAENVIRNNGANKAAQHILSMMRDSSQA